MSEVFAPSPGLVLGHYPQREDPPPGWVAQAVHGTVGKIRQRLRGRRSNLDRFAARVNLAEAEFAALSDSELQAKLSSIRHRLACHGFREDVAACSFALIREMASRMLGMRHFDVQIMGGWLILNGLVAEMETGEGKTLTATLPACTAALARVPVHIVTVNDYLVRRDAELMGPLYRALGLTVGMVTEGLDTQARQQAYACDITYCTNKQLVFDYLKDRLALGRPYSRLQFQMERLDGNPARKNALLLRGLCFAIVDEADSVMIDEARTPLIISQEMPVLEEQRVYQQALDLAKQLEPSQDFHILERSRSVELTGSGKAKVVALAASLGGIWNGKHRRLELVEQALSAMYLYLHDRHYLIREGKVQIVDEFTGRVMADRSWERGLHQLIEAKEGCAITGTKKTLARVSYQQFFRRYLLLAGMTGTAHEVAGELWAVYGLNVVTVPTNRPVRRVASSTQIFPSARQKWDAVVARIEHIHAQGRPVLVGTRSVAASEHLSGLLGGKGIAHQVLNARQDEHEADIIARAGEMGRIVVATNMAGRGTDIKLGPLVRDLGGLHVIATEMHESGRIDRQLFGRCGRQGDPGSFEMILSLEDELVKVYGSATVRVLVEQLGRGKATPAARRLAENLMWSAQRAAERSHSKMRRNMLKIDGQIRNALAFSGTSE